VEKQVVKAFKIDPITTLSLHSIERFNRIYLHVKRDYWFEILQMNRERSIRNHGLLLCNIIVNRPYVVGHNCMAGE
jgi:hypothetical protein